MLIFLRDVFSILYSTCPYFYSYSVTLTISKSIVYTWCPTNLICSTSEAWYINSVLILCLSVNFNQLMWQSWSRHWWSSFVNLTHLKKWHSSKSTMLVELVELCMSNLVLILSLVLKLQLCHAIIMIISLVKFFCWSKNLTKFKIICVSRTWNTKSSSHFVSGL